MRKWIPILLMLSVAPAFVPAAPDVVIRDVLSPRLAVAAALADLDAQNSDDQPFHRYLYLPIGEETFFPALRLHVNLISREAQLAYPKQVIPGLWRVDLRDYQWNAKVFEKLADIDPYFHRKQDQAVIETVEVDVDQQYGYTDAYGKWHDTEIRREKQKKQIKRVVSKNLLYVPNGATQLAGLALLTQSKVPIVRADWFLVQSARQISLNNKQTGAGYYDFLELRNRDDYFKLIGENENEAVRLQSEVRAVVSESGISAQNRQIVQTGVIQGKHWTTLDVFDQSGAGVAINHLRRGEFNHDAEEHYAPLANGLPVTFLCDAKGVRQDSAPDKLGGNKAPLNTSADLRIHVNLSCMQCHGAAVLMGVQDDVRPVYTGKLKTLSKDKNVDLELRRQYGQNLNNKLDKDRNDYQEVFSRTTGKSVKDTINLYSEAFTGYAYKRVDLKTAATEFGVSEQGLLKGLKDAAQRLGAGDFRTDPFLKEPPISIPRLNFEDAFQDTQDRLYGVLPQ